MTGTTKSHGDSHTMKGYADLVALTGFLPEHINFPVSRTQSAISLVLFFALLIGLPIPAPILSSQGLSVFNSFDRAGSLVFGGGRVVLPLLETGVLKRGWVSHDQFLAGYGRRRPFQGRCSPSRPIWGSC
ncbi:chromate transporter [Rhizobium hainanense]|uniref:Chromate transporter n=1 Tax=Rhizobium hainanense TaxID=52131 RepID=A0A1C3WJY4_9HYPH|nr:chromate transporter [Rhizobium hainanense]SCB40260.1 Chromate transporter [Rhizobium hainanense]